jgi:hypothetical protein
MAQNRFNGFDQKSVKPNGDHDHEKSIEEKASNQRSGGSRGTGGGTTAL